MASPAEQLADILAEALNRVIKDNPGLVGNPTVNVTESGGGGGGGTTIDPISLITGLGFFALLADPEAGAIIEALKGGAGSAGQSAESFGSGFALGSIAFLLAQPYLRYVTHFIENEAQSQIFEMNQAADLAARKIITPGFGQSESGGGGFDASHWASALDSAYVRPPYALALQMWNRGYIGESDVNTSLQYAAVPEYWWPFIKEMRRELLGAPDLALATLRGNMTQDDAATYAALLGVDADDFQTLIDNTGEPPGLMLLLEAFRRDYIDEPTLDHGIRQSRVRDEWIPTIKDLRYTPMSTSDAVRAVVQSYLTDDQGQAIAQQNGLLPEHWPYLREAWGRPLSHEQMMTLYYRGKATQDQVDQAFRESDLKDKYITQARELGVKLPALFETVNLLKGGELTGDMASKILLDQGYQPDVVSQIVKSAGAGKVATAKHLSVADIVTMYDAGIWSDKTSHEHLVSLGYTSEDADSILTVADTKATAKIMTEMITIVRTQFDRGKITEDHARTLLDDIGVPKDQRDRLLTDWALVKPDGAKQLTESQTVKLQKMGLISQDDATQRLIGLGYSQGDAILLLKGYGNYNDAGTEPTAPIHGGTF